MGASGEVGKTRRNLSRATKGTFSKRKDCIMKKTRELSVLCGVKACAIVFRPDDGRVETWPENLNEVQQVIDAYKDYSLKKKNGSISGDGDAKKRKVDYTGYTDFVGVEKKQKLSSATEMEYLGDELKKIDLTLEQVRNRIQILKQQKEGHGHGYGCGCGCVYGYASSSASKHYYEDFAAAREELLQIEDFDEVDHIFTLNELNMIQESSDKRWVQWDMNTQEYDQHLGLWANQYGYVC